MELVSGLLLSALLFLFCPGGCRDVETPPFPLLAIPVRILSVALASPRTETFTKGIISVDADVAATLTLLRLRQVTLVIAGFQFMVKEIYVRLKTDCVMWKMLYITVVVPQFRLKEI
jgi:hypothetical protein